MRDAMTHRGPDAAGIFQTSDRRVALAHRRLSIIDLSEAGRQPMTNEDGSIFITFNGSEFRCLFPERLPIFYMYSLRRGVSVKPWFLPPVAALEPAS